MKRRYQMDREKAVLGHLYMDNLKSGHLDDFMTWRRENEIAEVTIRHDLHALSQLCQYAQRQGWLEGNPVRLVDMPTDRDAVNERVLTDEEERVYFGAAHEHPALYDIGRLIILQGMRPAEVLSIEKEHVRYRRSHGSHYAREEPGGPEETEPHGRISNDSWTTHGLGFTMGVPRDVAAPQSWEGQVSRRQEASWLCLRKLSKPLHLFGLHRCPQHCL